MDTVEPFKKGSFLFRALLNEVRRQLYSVLATKSLSLYQLSNLAVKVMAHQATNKKQSENAHMGAGLSCGETARFS